jgi:hypothetical protein
MDGSTELRRASNLGTMFVELRRRKTMSAAATTPAPAPTPRLAGLAMVTALRAADGRLVVLQR